jgi:2-keto-4-pentenoate hydratase/2-oxohepta-3-ene-1,7-dioic acid hydratase in catechol pathway
MRLVTYDSGDGPRAGIWSDEGVRDAWSALGQPERASLRELIAEGRLGDLNSVAGGPVIGHDETALLPPIPDPDKIICIGLNYRAHAEEFELEIPAAPTVFAKFRNSLVGTGTPVTLPQTSEKVDYEAEIAFVIGRQAKAVPEEEALACVAGYTLLNDLSARDLQFLTPQWMPGKIFDGSAPCGPWLVTPDEAGPHDGIEITLDLNGERMQASSSADLIFSVPELVSTLSSWMTLEPGDIISTGTPSGVGSGRQPRVWLADGDRVEVSSPTLGTLVTPLVRQPD